MYKEAVCKKCKKHLILKSRSIGLTTVFPYEINRDFICTQCKIELLPQYGFLLTVEAAMSSETLNSPMKIGDLLEFLFKFDNQKYVGLTIDKEFINNIVNNCNVLK